MPPRRTGVPQGKSSPSMNALFTTPHASNQPVNSFLLALNSTPGNASLSGLELPPSVDLIFKPSQPVGIHFKWDSGAYKVVGFTDDSPAKKQNKIEEGCVLIMLNSINLHSVPQKVVNKMMVSCAKEERVLTFTAPKPKALPPRPTKPKPLPAKPAQREQPPKLQRRRSSSDDLSTPARRMRIVYEFTKPLVAMYRVKGIEAAIEKMRQIAAAKVIQKSIRGFLGRKFFVAAMKIRKFKAAQSIQKEVRRVLAIARADWLRRKERERIKNNAATVVNSVVRMKLAVLLANRLRAAKKRRRSLREANAAAKLQSVVRMRPEERFFKVVQAASKTIQKNMRAKLARTLVLTMRIRLVNATKIQSCVRRVGAVEKSKKRRRAVVVLQGMAKIWQAKRMLRELIEVRLEEVQEVNEVPRGDEEAKDGTPRELPGPDSSPPASQSPTPKESAANNGNDAQSPASSTATEQSADPLSPPDQSKFQLRFSPEAGTCLQKGELFGVEMASPTADVSSPIKPKSPETPMEEKFRRERYKKEVEARERMAVMVQSRWRGGESRFLVGAMKRVAAAVSQAKHMQRCRLVVKALIKRRSDAAVVIQIKVRKVLATKRVAMLRMERLEYCVEMMEAEFSIAKLGNVESGGWGDWGLPGDEEGLGGKDASKTNAKITQTQNMWLRTMPENSRYCYGCDIFRECMDDVDAGESYGKLGTSMLKMEFRDS